MLTLVPHGLSSSQPQYEAKAVLDVVQYWSRDSTDEFRQKVAVDGDHLRYVSDRVLREPCCFRGDQHVTWGINQSNVRSQGDRHDSADAAAIKGLGLHDQNGASKAWLGSGRFSEIGPPHLAAFDYHDSSRTDRAWRRASGVSSRLSSVP